MTLTAKQLDVLAQVRFTGMHYVPDVVAMTAGDGQPQRLHLSAVRRLVADGYLEVDDDDVWQVSAAGDAVLRGHPDYLGRAGRAAAHRQGEAIVSEMWRAKLDRQDTGDEEARVSAELTDALRAKGSAQIGLVEVTVPPEQWRRLARAAARSLGRPVQTLVAGDQLVAVLTDWPATDDEQRIQAARLRAAMESTSD